MYIYTESAHVEVHVQYTQHFSNDTQRAMQHVHHTGNIRRDRACR